MFGTCRRGCVSANDNSNDNDAHSSLTNPTCRTEHLNDVKVKVRQQKEAFLRFLKMYLRAALSEAVRMLDVGSLLQTVTTTLPDITIMIWISDLFLLRYFILYILEGIYIILGLV